jgi:hypothetical protein
VRKPAVSVDGYYYVSFNCKDIVITRKVRRLVFEAFNGPMPEGKEIDHVDGARNNNKLENLRALTHQENMIASVERKKKAQETNTLGTSYLI